MSRIIVFFVSLLFVLPFSLHANEVSNELQKVPSVMGAGNIVQIVAGLAVVLVMIIGAAWMLKRYGGFGGAANENLKVVAGISVGQREKIVVVQAGEVQLLVGVTTSDIRTLHVLDKPITALTVVDTPSRNGKDFLGHLKDQVVKRGGS